MDLYNKPLPRTVALRYSKPSPQEYLAHHGILGQKWGKRNGPPYPLDASDHSASEKKAGWRKSLDKGGKSEDNKKNKRKPKEIRAPEKKGLTDKQKTALKIGAALAVTALAAYGTYKLKESGKLDELIEKGRKQAQQLLGNDSIKNQKVSAFTDSASSSSKSPFGDIDFSTLSPKQPTTSAKPVTEVIHGFKKLAHGETIGEAVTKVNPSGGKENCRACSIATILRMKGLDVEAIGSVKGGSIRTAVEASFKDGKVSEMYSPTKERVTNFILSRYGEGSSGVIGARYNVKDNKPFGHAVSWCVKEGKVLFFDGQTGMSDFSKYLDYMTPDYSAEIARLDNLDLNPDGIKSYIKGR